MIKKLKIILLTLIIFLLKVGNSQSNVSSDVKDLYALWEQYYSSYHFEPIGGDKNDVEELYTTLYTYSSQNNDLPTNQSDLKYAIDKAQAEVYRKDYGLDFVTTYVENFDPGVGDDEDFVYNRRVQTGLDWHVLKNGYIQNKNRSKIKNNEAIITSLTLKNDVKKEERVFKWHAIIYAFNKQKIKILEQRLKLAEQRVEVAKKLHYLKKITQEELLKNITDYTEIKSMFNIYQSYNEQLVTQIDTSRLTFDKLPLIDINYTYTFQKLEHTVNDSVKNLLLENIDLENKTLNDISLRAFLRYNYYDMAIQNPSYRSFFSLGLSLGIPINFNRKAKKDLIEARKLFASNGTNADDNPTYKRDVLTDFYEFRYKLKQFNNYYYKRLLFDELLRKEQARYDFDPLGFNPVTALRLLDDVMSIDIELIDLKQQMYLKVLNIYTELPNTNISETVVTSDLEGKLNLPQAVDKEVYVWSSSLNKYQPNFIKNYLNLNAIKTTCLSVPLIDSLKTKASNLITLLNADSVSTHIMVGKNKLINGGIDEHLKGLLPVIKVGAKGIHLDIEPHTFDDWKTNKEKYIEQYIDLLNKTKQFCDANNIELSVSIPLHYPQETINKIYTLVDKVYFMAYENVKTDYIVRKVEGYNMDKTVIALRTNDFNNRLELEEKIIEIEKQIHPSAFIIHDLDSIIELDKKQIQNY